MSQTKLVKEIIELSEKNPDAEIKICVVNDPISDWDWTAHQIERVELSVWLEIGERVYTDELAAKDEITEMLLDDNTSKLSHSEFAMLVDEYFKQHAINAICVYTVGV